jgi:hypothetical protein
MPHSYAVFSGFFCLLFVAAFLSVGQIMWFHRHEWQVRGAEVGEAVFVPGIVTSVLYICAGCGKTESRTLNGNWTTNELKGSKP